MPGSLAAALLAWGRTGLKRRPVARPASSVHPLTLPCATTASSGRQTGAPCGLPLHPNRYISRLNGVLMVDFTDPAPRSFDGYIALQLHSGDQGNMKFKDIYLRDLTRR